MASAAGPAAGPAHSARGAGEADPTWKSSTWGQLGAAVQSRRGKYVDLADARKQLQRLEVELADEMITWPTEPRVPRLPPARGASGNAKPPRWTPPSKSKRDRDQWSNRVDDSFERMSPELEETRVVKTVRRPDGWRPRPVVPTSPAAPRHSYS